MSTAIKFLVLVLIMLFAQFYLTLTAVEVAVKQTEKGQKAQITELKTYIQETLKDTVHKSVSDSIHEVFWTPEKK